VGLPKTQNQNASAVLARTPKNKYENQPFANPIAHTPCTPFREPLTFNSDIRVASPENGNYLSMYISAGSGKRNRNQGANAS